MKYVLTIFSYHVKGIEMELALHGERINCDIARGHIKTTSGKQMRKHRVHIVI